MSPFFERYQISSSKYSLGNAGGIAQRCRTIKAIMRFSRLLIPAGALLILLLPHASLAASIGSFDPIIPQSGSCTCPGSAPSWGCVLQVFQHLINTGVSLGVVICVIWLAWAGALFIGSAGNPGLREQGKTRIMNGIIGMVVLLSAWLVVDFVMKTLYDDKQFGPWNAILASSGNDQCLVVNDFQAPLISGSIGFITSAPGTDTSNPLAFPSTGVGSCSASEVAQGAAAGGHPLSGNAANTLACIARFESGCGAKNLNYNWGKGSSAAGPFQILLGNNGNSFNNNACDAAVGLPAGTPLNCKAGFSGGNPSDSVIANRCAKAAANLNCSAAAASKLLGGNPSYQTFQTAYGTSGNDMNCVATYNS